MGGVGSKKRGYSFEQIDPPNPENDKYFVEKVVCKDEEFEDGTMAEFEMGQDGKILLVKENGKYSALGSKCTHYGASLKNGVLLGGRIRCPWHGACFDSTTGDIEDFPGLDSLPCYQVTVQEGDVKVKASLSALKSSKRVKPMVKYSHANPATFVIIGGGAAGHLCAETLRQEGFSGKIILITKENNLPYDRPKLSKALDSKPSDLYLRNDEFYKSVDISVMLETEVNSVDTIDKWVVCNNGKFKVKFDSLFIATGGQPITLKDPGYDLRNICYLRTPEDGQMIAKEASGKAVVIVGSSFIGMEVASYLSSKAKTIHIVTRNSVPFSMVFGKEIGEQIKSLFEEKGVIFHSGCDVVKFNGDRDLLKSVELSSGDILNADVCVIGIGVRPATDFLKDSGITMNNRGHIIVNEMLETNIKGIYAGGDIVEFPLTSYDNISVQIAHWQMALSHGHTAALNMLDKNVVFHSVPFFWTAMFGKSFRYAGYGNGYDEVIIKGDLEKWQFIAYYCLGPKVVAICTSNKDPEASKFASSVSLGDIITKEQIEA